MRLMVSILIVATLVAGDPARAADGSRPNIILILADDLGYGDLGCYGAATLKTPRLDQMRAEGMLFTQHYAGSTVCAPSRCVLMTGLHTGHCRIRGNSPGLLQPEDVTLAEVLKAAGYRTACIGKWGIGHPPPLDDPNRHGFDEFYGYVSMFHAHNFYPEFIVRNGRKEPLRNEVEDRWKDGDGRGIATRRVDYVPDLLADETLKFISDSREQPFFLYYALNIPHANNEATKSSRPERGLEVPSLEQFADRDWPAPEKGFATMVHNIDRDVGRILDHLQALQLDRRTLVLFTSDNGPHQEGGHQMEFFDSNGRLRGMKRDLYEGGVRVPFIAWWPGTIPPDSTSDHVSGFQDLLPTLAELAGQPVPDPCDGISLRPRLEGRTRDQRLHEWLYWEFAERGGRRSLRQGRWKLIQDQVSAQIPAEPELFDLANDLEEQHDVAARHPGRVRELLRLMDQAHQPSPAYPLFAGEKSAE